MQVFFTIFAIICGGIYFSEFDSFSPVQYVGYLIGLVLILTGVYGLAPPPEAAAVAVAAQLEDNTTADYDCVAKGGTDSSVHLHHLDHQHHLHHLEGGRFLESKSSAEGKTEGNTESTAESKFKSNNFNISSNNVSNISNLSSSSSKKIYR
jgi:hypothetical protein